MVIVCIPRPSAMLKCQMHSVCNGNDSDCGGDVHSHNFSHTFLYLYHIFFTVCV